MPRRCRDGCDHTGAHGTQNGYQYHYCRCDECREWRRLAGIKQKEKTRGREPPYHGAVWIYNHYGCHCGPCADAAGVYSRKRLRESALRPHTVGHKWRYQYGCRCELCREAWRVYGVARRARRRKSVPPYHGTRLIYSEYGCRCGPCKTANRVHQRERRGVHSTDTLPRVTIAMRADGFSSDEEELRWLIASQEMDARYGHISRERRSTVSIYEPLGESIWLDVLAERPTDEPSDDH